MKHLVKHLAKQAHGLQFKKCHKRPLPTVQGTIWETAKVSDPVK